MSSLKTALYKWRDDEAKRKGVDAFRVLPNAALDEIARTKPVSKQDFVAIKGLKDAKWAAYGKILAGLVLTHGGGLFGDETSSQELAPSPGRGEGWGGGISQKGDIDEPLSVSAYLDHVNDALAKTDARVRGEVSSLQFRGRAVYFGIKDTDDGSALSCFMWESDYTLSGIELTEGLEIIVDGVSEIYKPTGRMSFRARTVEYVGEGALKKAYDELKKKLDTEGLFAPERKKLLPDFPERIGLITSKQGAVIHDFQSNLGRYGYKISFLDSRVEGVAAVKDLLAAIRFFAKEDIDVLVVVRGGGSLESLQAFNNEMVVRALADFPHPTLVAIGHDKDVPLVDLVADVSPSTPTACATTLNRSWQEAEKDLRISGMRLVDLYARALRAAQDDCISARERLTLFLDTIREEVAFLERGVREAFGTIATTLEAIRHDLRREREALAERLTRHFRELTSLVKEYEKRLSSLDPMRQLRLGYSVLFRSGKLLRSASGIGIGDDFEARLSDGTIIAKVNKIKTSKNG